MKKLGCWFLGSVVLVVLALGVLFLVADRLLSTPKVKETIQQALVARTGLQIGYEKIGIGSFPLTLEFHRPTFSLPETLHGKADLLRLSPALFDLLTGKLDLGKIELVRPDIDLALSMPPAENRERTDGSPEKKADLSLASFFSLLPALHTIISDGRFAVALGDHGFSGEHLDLTVDGRVENARSGKASMRMALAEFIVRTGARREIIKDVHLQGALRADGDRIAGRLDRLSLAKPALALAGSLDMAQDGEEIALNLAGTDIDVDATRATALALAGDISPVSNIFTYLTGGTVPRITFATRGKSFSELGDLQHIRIEGHLQNGAVAIPEIDMQLAEVNGDVVIADGVLTGTGLSTRLAESTGHSGLLKLGLAEGNDLFRLELMVNADLGQVQRIVQRLAPKTKFSRELDRIANLKGTGVGKLILGDDLNDINVGIEHAAVKLACDYQRVPYPITLTKGSVNLGKDHVALSGVTASIGKSHVTDLAATVRWEKNVRLDIDAKHSGLSLDELFSYLNSMQETQALLKDIKELSGNVQLSAATFSGDMGAPQQWTYTAAGAVGGVRLQANGFPGPIQLTKGNFTLDRTQLHVQNLAVEGLDASLALNGTVSDVASKSGWKVDVVVDGGMAKDSVAWLEDALKVPKAYAIRAPLTLKGVRIAGKPKQAVSIAGGVLVKDGPQLILDIQYRPEAEELKGEKLTVKDQYSEAGLTFLANRDGLGASFAGRLGAETLAGLFVDQKWGKGDLEGDFSVHLPTKSKTKATAKGRLQGTNLFIPLGSREAVSIRQVALEANGSTVKADAASFSWRDFTWSPLVATIGFEQDTLAIKVERAALCGIDAPGVMRIAGKNIDLEMTLHGKHLDVGTSYTCLTQGRVKMTGTMECFSHVTAKGEIGELVGALKGPLTMTFRQGVIEQNRILSTLLEVLNVTEIVKGRLPNMATTGFAYSEITVDGQFRNGKLIVDKLYVDGETLDILGFGEIDIDKETLNLELLAAPFKTVDTIIKYVPGVNYLMGDSLVVVPVNVTGTLTDPKVSVMSPSAVSKGLLNLGSRVLKLPYKLMESILSGGKKAGKAIF